MEIDTKVIAMSAGVSALTVAVQHLRRALLAHGGMEVVAATRADIERAFKNAVMTGGTPEIEVFVYRNGLAALVPAFADTAEDDAASIG